MGALITFEAPCGSCDSCASGDVEAAAGGDDHAWHANDRVNHDAWGDGVVMRCETDRVTVLFETVGYKFAAAGKGVILVSSELPELLRC